MVLLETKRDEHCAESTTTLSIAYANITNGFATWKLLIGCGCCAINLSHLDIEPNVMDRLRAICVVAKPC